MYQAMLPKGGTVIYVNDSNISVTCMAYKQEGNLKEAKKPTLGLLHSVSKSTSGEPKDICKQFLDVSHTLRKFSSQSPKGRFLVDLYGFCQNANSSIDGMACNQH
ncbi:hypothetical protein JTE90_029065 [Oedothorax gibbosus]|uniref:Uncharacterized protein n=1 Tax=Oedothorax gibbosus TaxID=931172 RepID=A0AAV6UWY3_9ARAC|nr:hypothetical protein JTE90_029065 [Oedothorax gibbosus]